MASMRPAAERRSPHLPPSMLRALFLEALFTTPQSTGSKMTFSPSDGGVIFKASRYAKFVADRCCVSSHGVSSSNEAAGKPAAFSLIFLFSLLKHDGIIHKCCFSARLVGMLRDLFILPRPLAIGNDCSCMEHRRSQERIEPD